MNLLLKKEKMTDTYHIYLNGVCLFKNLDQYEFDIIWGRLYHSYWDGLEYEKVHVDEKELVDSSY